PRLTLPAPVSEIIVRQELGTSGSSPDSTPSVLWRESDRSAGRSPWRPSDRRLERTTPVGAVRTPIFGLHAAVGDHPDARGLGAGSRDDLGSYPGRRSRRGGFPRSADPSRTAGSDDSHRHPGLCDMDWSRSIVPELATGATVPKLVHCGP